MSALRSIASETEQQLLLDAGLIEERHLDVVIDAEQDAGGETYYRIDDIMVVFRAWCEPTAHPLPDDFELVFDNGGGVTLQTPRYSHYYDDPAQVADDVRAYLATESTADWDGDDLAASCDAHNQPAYRIDRLSDVRNYIAAGHIETSWSNVSRVYRALGVNVNAD